MEAINTNERLRSVWKLLQITFGLMAIIAGFDKFTDILTDWDMYLNHWIAQMLPCTVHTFMQITGLIEIVAGVIVFAKPKTGGYIVAVWLVLIALNLITGCNFYDVAVRDIVMAIGAFSLARLTDLIPPPLPHI